MLVDATKPVGREDILAGMRLRHTYAATDNIIADWRCKAGGRDYMLGDDFKTSQRHEVTAGFYNDDLPVFDPDGKYLYFLSYREFDPVYDNMHFDLVDLDLFRHVVLWGKCYLVPRGDGLVVRGVAGGFLPGLPTYKKGLTLLDNSPGELPDGICCYLAGTTAGTVDVAA